jgi:hypothetical protein
MDAQSPQPTKAQSCRLRRYLRSATQRSHWAWYQLKLDGDQATIELTAAFLSSLLAGLAPGKVEAGIDGLKA